MIFALKGFEWYVGYVVDTANDIAYARGDMGHILGVELLPFYQIGVKFYP